MFGHQNVYHGGALVGVICSTGLLQSTGAVVHLYSSWSPPSTSGAITKSNRAELLTMLRSVSMRRGRTTSLMPSTVSAISVKNACAAGQQHGEFNVYEMDYRKNELG